MFHSIYSIYFLWIIFQFSFLFSNSLNIHLICKAFILVDVQDSDWWPSYNRCHSSNPYAFSMAQTSVPQIYQILKSAFNSQIYVLFEILKSASNSQIHERFSLSPIDVQWRHSRMLQMTSHPLGVWNNDGKATLPDSRWGILEKRKKRKKKSQQ